MSTTTSSVSEIAGSRDAAAVVDVESISLCFRSYTDPYPSLKQSVLNKVLRRRRAPPSEFWLFRDFNLRIEHGSRLGIVGPNGAGKSTLLKLICGIYRPTRGKIRIKGRIAPLIELGAGMIPELSGEENILLNGALLGFSRQQMKAKLDSILDFAGLQEFRDMPLKYYSSGMSIRLTFAVATDIDPEVLLIDEVFSAGDAEFMQRAKERMDRLLDASHIVVIVSHNLHLINQLCTRAIWLDGGRIVANGTPVDVTRRYLQSALNPR